MDYKTDLNNTSTYGEAPQMLLEKMIALGDIIEKSKAKGAKPESLEFYVQLNATMKFAYAYMMDVEWVHQRSQTLELENRFLRQHMHTIQQRLNEYEVITKLKAEGKLEETCQKVDQFIANIPNRDTND